MPLPLVRESSVAHTLAVQESLLVAGEPFPAALPAYLAAVVRHVLAQVESRAGVFLVPDDRSALEADLIAGLFAAG